MRTSWIVYAVLAVLGVCAGLLVAGIPDRQASDQVVVAGSVVAPSTEALATEPEVTISPSPTTTAAPTTTSAPPTTAAPTTTAAPPPAEPPPIDRASVALVVANGSTIGGIAGTTADAASELGWTNVSIGDGTEVFGGTVVYFVDGFGDAANQLAADLGLEGFVVPIDGAPALQGDALEGAQVLLYLGNDRADAG
ncbi:MAG: LytR C-terminal domain-containing protein [Actinomycetota bacterium]